MTPEKIIAVIEMYEARLRRAGIPKLRMDPKHTFESLSKAERLQHAHFLCEGVKEYARDPQKQQKAARYLTVVQMCLSFAGWYTLEDLMNHNRPKRVLALLGPKPGPCTHEHYNARIHGRFCTCGAQMWDPGD